MKCPKCGLETHNEILHASGIDSIEERFVSKIGTCVNGHRFGMKKIVERDIWFRIKEFKNYKLVGLIR